MAEEKINLEETEEVVKKRVKRSFQTIILDKVRARAESKHIGGADLKVIEDELKLTLKKFEDLIKQSKKANLREKNRLSKLQNYTAEELEEYLKSIKPGK